MKAQSEKKEDMKLPDQKVDRNDMIVKVLFQKKEDDKVQVPEEKSKKKGMIVVRALREDDVLAQVLEVAVTRENLIVAAQYGKDGKREGTAALVMLVL